MNVPIDVDDIIAVSDIHGCHDLFEQFLNHICGTGARVVVLGDMIDRGRECSAVLNKVKVLLDNHEAFGLGAFYCLLGNHEVMFIDAMTGTASSYALWVTNGGNHDQVDDMRKHIPWLRELPIYMTIGDRLFIHGGIFPGRDPHESILKGKSESLIWMREPFLTYGPEFEKWNPNLKEIVFGHTPKMNGYPYYIPQGVCIDTGSFFTGVLTAYNVTKGEFYQYKNKRAAVR